ncbi:MAG: RRXRR domain-containing protein [Roseburia faecis]|nr:RRXRR domain-containing protein [Roseburia faecis]
MLAADGSPLMPTYNIRKVRRMLKDGRAVTTGHKPGFTIRLAYALPDQKAPHTQKVELCEDTGYQHIGVSAKSAKHEYVHLEFFPHIKENPTYFFCTRETENTHYCSSVH